MTAQKLKPYSYFVRLYDLNLRNTTDYARGESSHRQPAFMVGPGIEFRSVFSCL